VQSMPQVPDSMWILALGLVFAIARLRRNRRHRDLR